MKLSVIIPAYNDLQSVMECLVSLQTYASRQVDITFLVQDDCSPDVLLPVLIPPCTASVARNPVNFGFGGNCNAGAARTDSDILMFVNQDVFAAGQDLAGRAYSQGWDLSLMNAFDNPNVGIVGAKLIFPDGSIQSAGGLFDGHCQPFHRCLGYGDHQYWEVNEVREVSWVTGAALAIRKPLFDAVGGFDTAYIRGYWEDVDLCMKARECGAEIWYEPSCQLVHRVGSSGGSVHFRDNMMLWKSRWVDTGKVTPDISAVKERWW